MTVKRQFYLLRGLIRESRHWGEFSTELKSQFPESEIILMDIPGTGKYYKSPSPTTIKEIVDHLRLHYYIQNSTDQNSEKIIICISLGGMICTEWMKSYPNDFSRAFLINTSFSDFSPFYKRLKLSAFFYLLPVFLMRGRSKEAWILKLVSNHQEHFNKTLDLWEKIQNDQPVSSLNALKQVWAAMHFKVDNFVPTIPVVILVSEKDRMVDPVCSLEIAKRWNTPLLKHSTGGHDLSADDGKWIVNQITNNLN